MRSFLALCLIFICFSCSKNISFETQDKIGLKEAYFMELTAGVKGGGAGYNIYLILDQEKSDSNSEIELEGIYFRNYFGELKMASKGKYQAFIKSNANTNTIEPILNANTTADNQETKDEFPFKLEENEAVIRFTEKGIKKYFKTTLVQKELENYPM